MERTIVSKPVNKRSVVLCANIFMAVICLAFGAFFGYIFLTAPKSAGTHTGIMIAMWVSGLASLAAIGVGTYFLVTIPRDIKRAQKRWEDGQRQRPEVLKKIKALAELIHDTPNGQKLVDTWDEVWAEVDGFNFNNPGLEINSETIDKL